MKACGEGLEGRREGKSNYIISKIKSKRKEGIRKKQTKAVWRALRTQPGSSTGAFAMEETLLHPTSWVRPTLGFRLFPLA